jgi:hypothetical protein
MSDHRPLITKLPPLCSINDNNQLEPRIWLIRRFTTSCFKNRRRHSHIKILLYIRDSCHCSNRNRLCRVGKLNFLRVWNSIRRIRRMHISNITWEKSSQFSLDLWGMITLVVFTGNISFKLIRGFMWHHIWDQWILMMWRRRQFN